MAVPATQNLTITRGDTEIVVITIKDSTGTAIDITGRTYRAQIRSTKDSASISVSFSCAITNPTAGVVTCTLSATNSGTLSAGKYYWDFEENNAGVVTTIIAGGVTVLADVTR